MPGGRRRPKFHQHLPTPAVAAPFVEVERVPGENYWHAVISDAIHGDRPEFRYVPPKRGCPFTPQELANVVAGELNEGRGYLILQEFADGIPVFSSAWISNGRQVLCHRSSDHARQPETDFRAALSWLRREVPR